MSDELDDFFRQELDGHATAPGADLWARLQARTAAPEPAAEADPLDAKFRAGLAGHATPPRRELWERLEDEYLRPRQRRPVVAWGRLAVAASLLLLLLAGGASLWRGQPAGPVATATRQPAGAGSASSHTAAQPTEAAGQAAPTSRQPAAQVAHAAPEATVANHSSQPPTASDKLKKQLAGTDEAAFAVSRRPGRERTPKYFSTQATALAASPSSSPVASTSRPPRPATARRPVPALPTTTSQPDAAANTLAQDGGRKSPASQPAPDAAPEAYVVEVEVRRGPDSDAPAPVAVAAAEPAAAPRRVRVVGLLQQADHLLHGEPASLREAAAAPAPITLQARLGGRIISKTIRL